MDGELAAIKDEGYGFISLGEGKPQVFVRVMDVPPHLWRKGARLSFVVQPPKKGRCWIATEVQSAGNPSVEDLDAVAAEEEIRRATRRAVASER